MKCIKWPGQSRCEEFACAGRGKPDLNLCITEIIYNEDTIGGVLFFDVDRSLTCPGNQESEN